jgi:hypothetical protein
MGTQGLSGRVGFGRRRDDRAWDGGVVHWRLNLIAVLAILPIAAGCSLSPPWSSSANQTAAVPPPPNYPATATGQPAYTPPPGQQAYAPLAQPAYATPAATAAAAPPPAQQDYSDSLPYPKQSLIDAFRGSTQTPAQGQTQGATQVATQGPPQYVPHPPSTYTPSGQPYSPPLVQPPNNTPPPAATAAAAPPGNPEPTDSLPYPKQSLFEVFSNKQ